MITRMRLLLIAALLPAAAGWAGTDDVLKDAGTGLPSGVTADSTMVITGGKVGIGESSPQVLLDLLGNGSSAGAPDAGTIARFARRGGAWSRLSILSDVKSFLDLGDNADQDIGSISYDQSSNKMEFITNAGTRMSIDSAGKVGIGTTSPGETLQVEGTAEFGTGSNTVTVRHDASFSMTGLFDGSFAIATKDANGYVYGGLGTPNSGSGLYVSKNSTSVGIGTRSPAAGLHVKVIGGVSDILIENGITADSRLELKTSGATSDLGVRFNNTNGGADPGEIIWSKPAGMSNFGFGITGGNVGIGTNSPGETLQVEGTAEFGTGSNTVTLRHDASFSKTGLFDGSFSMATRDSTGYYYGGLATPPNTSGLFVSNSGTAVGVGTNNPGAGLHVLVTGDVADVLIENAIPGDARLELKTSGGTADLGIRFNNTNGGADAGEIIWSKPAGMSNFGLGITGGNVGIGTSLADTILTVNNPGVSGEADTLEIRTDSFTGGEMQAIKWTTSSGAADVGRIGMAYDAAADQFDFVIRDLWDGAETDNDSLFVVEGGGNVGIGTAAPEGLLHVKGTVNGNPTSGDFAGKIVDGDGTFGKLSGARAIAISGDFSYIVSTEGLVIADISDPLAPTLVSETANTGVWAFLSSVVSVTYSGGFLFMAATNADAFAIVDVSIPASPVLEIEINDGDTLGGDTVNFLDHATGVFVQGDYAFVTARDDDAMTIFDISDPAAPTLVSETVNGTGSFTLLDGPGGIWVSGDFAYINCQVANSFVIIDVNVKTAPTLASETQDQTSGTEFTQLAGGGLVRVQGDFAYFAATVDDALTIIDVSNPSSPVWKSDIQDGVDGFNLIDLPEALDVVGNLAIIGSFNDNAITIIDISDPTAMSLITTISDGADADFSNLSTVIQAQFDKGYAYVVAENAVTIIDIAGGAPASGDFIVTDNGSVGIGTTTTGSALDVHGQILQHGSLLHADYVFEEDYELASIGEHGERMMANKHLPAIGGRKVDSSGLDVIELGSHRRGMLEELEIAHLYILELKGELTALGEQSTAQMLALRAEFDELRTSVELEN